MSKFFLSFFIILLMLAQPTVVFANNELNINKEETQKATVEFVNFFMSNFNNLQKQITNVSQKNLELEAKIEELKKENSALTQENLELEAKIEELSKTTVSNKSELDANKSKLEKVKEDMDSSSQKFKENYVSKDELEKIKKDIIQLFNELIDKLSAKTN